MCDRSEEGYQPFVPSPSPAEGTADYALMQAALGDDVEAARAALKAGADTECLEVRSKQHKVHTFSSLSRAPAFRHRNSTTRRR
jgi:hypothetical protein